MAAALADHLGDRVLSAPEAVNQRLVAERLFQGVEVGALDILDDGDLKDVEIVKVAHQHRHRVQASPLGRAPTPLARDDLKFPGRAGHGPDKDRLQHPLFADRRGQFLQLRFVELAAGLFRIASDELDRGVLGRAGRTGSRDGSALACRLVLSQQGGEPAPKTASFSHTIGVLTPPPRPRADAPVRG